MPDFLAIDWERRQLCGLEADVSRDRVRGRRFFNFAWPEEIDPLADVETSGRLLREALKEQQIRAKQALIVLPREDAVVRHLLLPNAPDEELPDLVRFQAADKSTLPLDRLLLDFVPLAPREDGTGRDVLMATIPKATAEKLTAIGEAAGLEIVSIGLSPLAAAALVDYQVPAQEVPSAEQRAGRLIVVRHKQRVEITILRGDDPVLSHSARLSEAGPEQSSRGILTEIGRSFVALQKLDLYARPSHVWIVDSGEWAETLREGLRSRFECPVDVLDPLTAIEMDRRRSAEAPEPALLAGPVGMLLTRAGATAPTIDFLAPRRAPRRIDPKKLRAAVVAGVAVAAAIVLMFVRMTWIGRLDDRIQQLRVKEAALKKQIADNREVFTAAADLEAWESSRVDWLARINELADAMELVGGTERLYLTEVTGDPGRGDVRADMSAKGFARSRADVEALTELLAENERYRIPPKPIEEADRDPDYPRQFELEIEMLSERRPGGRGSTSQRSSARTRTRR